MNTGVAATAATVIVPSPLFFGFRRNKLCLKGTSSPEASVCCVLDEHVHNCHNIGGNTTLNLSCLNTKTVSLKSMGA